MRPVGETEITVVTIPAGTLHGLSEGAVLAVMESAAAADADALGFVELTSVETFASTAQSVEKDGKVLPAELPKGMVLRKLDEAGTSLTPELREQEERQRREVQSRAE